jgi:hypothetical protein
MISSENPIPEPSLMCKKMKFVPTNPIDSEFFRPFKDSSLHKLRGLIAACLGSGVLGEMWRLLMQGDKSNA